MSRKVFRRAVTETSTTLSNLGEIGDERFEGGKKYRLVYTATSMADNNFLGLATADSTFASYGVESATHTKPVFGVNDTGASMAASTYFWALVEGPLFLSSDQCGAALTANTYLALSSDETVKDLASNEAYNVAKIGYTNAAVVSTNGGWIWFQPTPSGNAPG